MELILLFTFLSVACLVLAASQLAGSDPARERLRRLQGIAGREGPEDPHAGVLLDEGRGVLVRLLGHLGGTGADPNGAAARKTRRRLIQAGWRRPGAVPVYLGLRLLCALGLPLLLLLSRLSAGLDPSRLVALLALATGIGLVAPSWLLDRRIQKRQLGIEQGLPDALDLLVVCIEAGLALTASVARVATEYARSNPALAEEFELVALESHAGRSTVEALRGLAERTGLSEVSSLVAMLIQTERFGTSVADALRVHADAMRVRRIQKAEEAASKAPLKMLFPAGLFIFPATLILIAGPGVLRLVTTLSGN